MANSKTVNNTNIRNMNVVVNNFLFHVHGAAVRAAYAEHDAASDAAFEARRIADRAEAEARRAQREARVEKMFADSADRMRSMEEEFHANCARMHAEHAARIAARRG